MKNFVHNHFLFIVLITAVTLLLFAVVADAKKKKNQKSSGEMTRNKAKTKTKWSSTIDTGVDDLISKVATEEHGYYVKRTFFPVRGIDEPSLKSPPFLAVPIAWIACENRDCLLHLNSAKNSLTEGFLCDDDCHGVYHPICGKTLNEVAVFYNECKLNVAKCRTRGYWLTFNFEDCKKLYPEGVKYAESKFRASPYFRDADNSTDSLIKEDRESNSGDMLTEKFFVQKFSDNVTKENRGNFSDHNDDDEIKLINL
uniref:Kazal-like domain-containing protein n=1 Tax=Glossina morsitans morsitans TaxID=37546 RepID=A0A1B0G8L1_GLOMM